MLCRRLALFFSLLAAAFCADGAQARGPQTGTALPVTHVLRKQYQLTDATSSAGRSVVESRYKDLAGRTVATSKTVGGLTTHFDASGTLLGYSLVANGRTWQYDAHGRQIR